jgi:hypothetical protein
LFINRGAAADDERPSRSIADASFLFLPLLPPLWCVPPVNELAKEKPQGAFDSELFGPDMIYLCKVAPGREMKGLQDQADS